MSNASPLSASITLRVRYFETDQMQVAHHAHYLVWFEAARSEFCRVHGMDYTQMERQGCFLPIVEASCRYRAPARYDEEITVTTYVIAVKRRTLRMGYTVTRKEAAHDAANDAANDAATAAASDAPNDTAEDAAHDANKETLLATGETYQIVVGPDKRPRTLPDAIFALFAPQGD